VVDAASQWGVGVQHPTFVYFDGLVDEYWFPVLENVGIFCFRDFEIVQTVQSNFFALALELPWARWQVIGNIRDAEFNAELRNSGIPA
jgi:hypothetical protein